MTTLYSRSSKKVIWLQPFWTAVLSNKLRQRLVGIFFTLMQDTWRRLLMDAYNESGVRWDQVDWLNWLITCVGTGVGSSNRGIHASSPIGLKPDVYPTDLAQIWPSCKMQLYRIHRTYVPVYQQRRSLMFGNGARRFGKSWWLPSSTTGCWLGCGEGNS